MTGQAGDESARDRLKRQKRLATGLLVVMAVLLASTFALPPGSLWTGLLRAAAEAGLVGGLADWFAVTALFRHPFGLPVPHTAIIPRHKDRIGVALGRFVATHFLTAEALAPRLRRFDPAGRLAGWLAQPEMAKAAADRLGAMLPFLVDRMQDEDLRGFLRDALYRELAQVDAAPFVGRALAAAVRGGHHHALYDQAVTSLRRLVDAQRDTVLDEVGQRTAWWVPRAVDRRIAQSVLSGIEDFLERCAAPEGEPRRRIDQALHDLAGRLESDPALRQRLDGMLAALLADPGVRAGLEALWDDIRNRLHADLARPDSRLRGGLARGLEAMGKALAADPALRERLNRRLELVLRGVLLPERDRVAAFIAETVQAWDADDVTDRLELAVGRDLQFIRINGTLIGALAGVVIYAVVIFAGHVPDLINRF
jgi:uncharacterized membrane-anchored protein YjiN (DUF445 family)